MKRLVFFLCAVCFLPASIQTQDAPPAAQDAAALVIELGPQIVTALEAATRLPESQEKTDILKALMTAGRLFSSVHKMAKTPGTAPAASPPASAPRAPEVKAGDLFPEVTLRDGKTYKNAKVKSYDAGAVIFSYEGGMVRVPLANLPDELQAKFAYDAAAAAESERLMWERQRAIPKLAPASAVAPDPENAPPSNPQDGINLYGIDAKAIDTSSDTYVDVAWKVTVLNHGSRRTDGVSLRFLFLDEKGFQVAEDVEYPLSFEPGETRTLTGKAFMLRSIWSQVDSYRVKTR